MTTNDEQGATFDDGFQAGKHWPGPTPATTEARPIPTVEPSMTRCIHCGNEYDLNVHGRETEGLRCPMCATLTRADPDLRAIPSPVTGADAIERGRRAAHSYNPSN